MPPALWSLLFAPGGRAGNALETASGTAVFAGLLCAAQAASLPSRTSAARATDIVGVLPARRYVSAGRTLAALLAATVLVLLCPLLAGIAALIRGHAPWPALPILGPYLAAVLPAAWVGAGAGLLAGSVVRDTRLALLAVFGGGAVAIGALGLQSLLSPLGALDVQFQSIFSASGGLWPLRGLVAWHAVTLTGVAALLAILATGFRVRGGGWPLAWALGAAACLAGGFLGYGATLHGFAIGGRPSGAAGAGWSVREAAVTLRLGTPTTASADLVLLRTGSTPAATVTLVLPPGLRLTRARLGGAPGVSLTPAATLRLPRSVAPGAAIRLRLRYGGRWTAFSGRAAYTLIRGAGPGHLILAGLGPARWLPAPPTETPVPLRLRLTGATPAAAFCNLRPIGPDAWSGTSGAVLCIGGDLRPARAGAAAAWTTGVGTAGTIVARALERADAAMAACLREPPVAVGLLATPAALQASASAGYDLYRYREAAPVSPDFTNAFGLTAPDSVWSAAVVAWGLAQSPAPPGDPLLRAALIGLLPTAAARAARIPAPAASTLPTGLRSPGGQAVQTALQRLSPRAGCRLLARLHALDRRAALDDAAVGQAIAATSGRAS